MLLICELQWVSHMWRNEECTQSRFCEWVFYYRHRLFSQMWLYQCEFNIYRLPCSTFVFIKRPYRVQELKTMTQTDRTNPYLSTTAYWSRLTLLNVQKWFRTYCSRFSETWQWRWLLRPSPSRIRMLLNSSKSYGSCPTFISRSECSSKLFV